MRLLVIIDEFSESTMPLPVVYESPEKFLTDLEENLKVYIQKQIEFREVYNKGYAEHVKSGKIIWSSRPEPPDSLIKMGGMEVVAECFLGSSGNNILLPSVYTIDEFFKDVEEYDHQ